MKDYEITLWGSTHYVNFTKHIKERSVERELDDFSKKSILLSLERCKNLISEHVTDEPFVIMLSSLLSFVVKRREGSVPSLDIITVVKGPTIKMYEGQKFFHVDMDGVSYNQFIKRSK